MYATAGARAAGIPVDTSGHVGIFQPKGCAAPPSPTHNPDQTTLWTADQGGSEGGPNRESAEGRGGSNGEVRHRRHERGMEPIGWVLQRDNNTATQAVPRFDGDTNHGTRAVV